MHNLFPRESLIVLSIMVSMVVVATVARYTYRDVIALFDRPSQEEIVAGEKAIDALESSAEAVDTGNLIAAVEPCSRWRGYQEACVTVTDNWSRAGDPQRMAAQLWQAWASICTQERLADGKDDCFLQIRGADGAVLGGSAHDDSSRIWVRH